MHDTAESRRKRKEEGRQRKRQKIQESGGVRPRDNIKLNKNDNKGSKKHSSPKTSSDGPSDNGNGNAASGGGGGGDKGKNSVIDNSKPKATTTTTAAVATETTPRNNNNKNNNSFGSSYKRENSSSFGRRPFSASSSSLSSSGHRFGRVMQKVPCRNKPRFSTLSIALPGSVLSNCQTKELRTLLVGQIARAATIYHVDEIIVFDDKLGKTENHSFGSSGGGHGAWKHRKNKQRDHHNNNDDAEETGNNNNESSEQHNHSERGPRSNPQEFMARVLQYCECPQYLRRQFFPMHPDLQFTGLLAPIDAPHHVRADDHSMYREGVVLEKTSADGGSLVNCGIKNRPVAIDRKLTAGIRCTVKIDPAAYGKVGLIKGTVVSPSTPREHNGTYWGYTTRMANSINNVFDECPFEGGKYDLKIGTSERGDISIEDGGGGGKSNKNNKFSIPKYEHALIVFGGVAGIEECVDADETIKLPGAQSKKLFDMWLNTCPFQGSRTIRTEEAVLISLATLSPALAKSARSQEIIKEEIPDIEFSDEAPSDESSDDDDDDESESEDEIKNKSESESKNQSESKPKSGSSSSSSSSEENNNNNNNTSSEESSESDSD